MTELQKYNMQSGHASFCLCGKNVNCHYLACIFVNLTINLNITRLDLFSNDSQLPFFASLFGVTPKHNCLFPLVGFHLKDAHAQQISIRKSQTILEIKATKRIEEHTKDTKIISP